MFLSKISYIIKDVLSNFVVTLKDTFFLQSTQREINNKHIIEGALVKSYNYKN